MNPSDVVVVIPASLPGGEGEEDDEEKDEEEEERNLLSLWKEWKEKGKENGGKKLTPS